MRARPVGQRINLSHSRRGVIAVLVAVSLIGIIAIAALSLDAGKMLDERRQAQAAADAAAMAAALDMFAIESGDTTIGGSQATTSALAIAKANGYANDGVNSKVVVNIPPQSGNFAGKAGYVEVIVTWYQARGFSRMFGNDPVPVSARSVAAGTFVPTQASVLVIDPKSKNALNLKKGGSLLSVAGDLIVNSRDKKAVTIDKGAEVQAQNVLLSSRLDKKILQMVEQRTRGDVYTNVPATADPLAGLDAPDPGVSRKRDDYKTSKDGVNTYNLQPGKYGDDLKFDKDDVVNMAPGVYTLEKGLEMKKGSSLTAPNVMLYSSAGKKIKFDSSDIQLSAPNSGTYAGIAIFQAREKKGKVEFKKDADLQITGTVYAPNGEVKFQDSDATFDESDDAVFDTEEDDSGTDDGTSTSGSIGVQIIARKLTIDKRSTVYVGGSGISAKKPLITVVE